VTFQAKPGELLLSVSTADVGEAQETVSVEYDGPEIEVSFNSNYVLDSLKTFESDQVVLKLKDGETAGILEPGKIADDEELLCLVMPLRVAQLEEVTGE
jgi:DNA polymerase-3 subunit beta